MSKRNYTTDFNELYKPGEYCEYAMYPIYNHGSTCAMCFQKGDFCHNNLVEDFRNCPHYVAQKQIEDKCEEENSGE